MKVIGSRKKRTPEENLKVLEELVREASVIRPPRKIKKGVMRFKTWEDLYEFSVSRASRGV